MADLAFQPPRDAGAPAPDFPHGWALPLIESAATTAPTRRALLARLEPDDGAGPHFFSSDAYETFRAACARLVPSTGLAADIDVAPAIDRRLADGTGDGWRYATLPPDGEAFRIGVALLDRAAEIAHAERFADLSGEAQDAILTDVQHTRGSAFAEEPFAGFDAVRWFADWISEAAGRFFSHPLAQDDIGYAGFADAPGWTRIRLGEREAREPEPLPPTP